jgi:hypothetical protein
MWPVERVGEGPDAVGPYIAQTDRYGDDMKRFFLACLLAVAPTLASAGESLTIEVSETAGISGLRPFWDHPVVVRGDGATEESARGRKLQSTIAVWRPDLGFDRDHGHWQAGGGVESEGAGEGEFTGATVFDAVHRSVLVRFPYAAEAILDKMGSGLRVTKAEIVFPFKGTEMMPRGYREPTPFVDRLWDDTRPRWHAVAWALRRPWTADRKIGPTFNAAINGAVYWKKYGASDENEDRFKARFGPAEVSYKASEGIDITAAINDRAFGATYVERIRRIADCGFLVKKWEEYDAHFTTPGYEWAIATGSRGILTGNPKLVVAFERGRTRIGRAVPPANVHEMAKTRSGEPTIEIPSAERFEELKAKYAFADRRPAWMPDWQWERVSELHAAGGRSDEFPASVGEYEQWLDRILGTQPRRWEGHDATDQLLLYREYKDALSEYIGDHWRRYWTAHLMPHKAYFELTHNQYHQIWTEWRALGSDYVDRTDDWRGNKSFYRESYNRYMSTMNFNHTASLGALLGGGLIGSEKAVADGRFGLEHFPLRLWAWYDGSLQEAVDHCHLSHTIATQKMFVDYAPGEFDRMLGKSILRKSIEELATCYHPGLRRFVSTGLRTTPFYATHIQEGVAHVAHSLSQKGVLTDLERAAERGTRNSTFVVWGGDVPPRRVALQSLKSPWAPSWMSAAFDEKALPFEMKATWRQWGAYRSKPKFRTTYLGTHYGLASFDFNSTPTLNMQAMWKRTKDRITTADDLGQLLVRFGYNRTNFIATKKGGSLGNMGGSLGVLQHRGKAIVVASPHAKLKATGFEPKKEEIRSIQTSICLFDHRPFPTWKIYVDGRPVNQLPHTCRSKSRIAIHDGATYIGVVPIRSTDLCRDAEIVISPGGKPVATQTGPRVSESLLIENFFYRSDEPFDLGGPDAEKLDAAWGGFVIEIGDESEYDSFAAFDKHIRRAKLGDGYSSRRKELELVYRSTRGPSREVDTLRMNFRPVGADGDARSQTANDVMPVRTVNEEWPYLPEGIERETPLSVIGTSGTLAKGDSQLMLEPGRMGYVFAEPKTGTYLGANPMPDVTYFRFQTPGATLTADGRIGLGFFAVCPATRRIEIDYAVNPEQSTSGLATSLIVSGMAGKPRVTLNGRTVEKMSTVQFDGAGVWVVPLVESDVLVDAPRIHAAHSAAREAFAADAAAVAKMTYERGEHYLVARPAVGAWSLQRLWPSGTMLRATTPEGITVTADGRLALLHLSIDIARKRVEVFAPRYLHDCETGHKFGDKAKSLLIAGFEDVPAVIVNGKEYLGRVRAVTLYRTRYYVIPLYENTERSALHGLKARFRLVKETLPDH